MLIVKVSQNKGVIEEVLLDNGKIASVPEVLNRINKGENFSVNVSGKETKVRPTKDGKYITTNPDGSKCNNLDNLPKITTADRIISNLKK